MRLLVISDIHGARELTLDVIRREMALPISQRPDTLLFLGDGLRDIEDLAYYGEFATLAVLSVRGNCDFFGASDTPELREVPFGGVRVMMMHGHRYEVKSGLARATSFAASRGCDILLFGHTHVPFEKCFAAGESVGDRILKKPLVLFNPGSLGQSGNYGRIEILGENIRCFHKTV